MMSSGNADNANNIGEINASNVSGDNYNNTSNYENGNSTNNQANNFKENNNKEKYNYHVEDKQRDENMVDNGVPELEGDNPIARVIIEADQEGIELSHDPYSTAGDKIKQVYILLLNYGNDSVVKVRFIILNIYYIEYLNL
ncbi:hypothetical protein AOQ84DRAFT_85846 [Glonium stellatum]|uniref:Uncharacterized protein n=1 Tax=Glonium stellatum TaxID=574774 RepID=A0A8E2FC75_9PEZI|nr:hypothetical protein AOQ84DRAFT_85846 [Glonium stellatum]